MPLNESQKQKLRSWLKDKGARPTCVSCGQDEWGTGELVSTTVLNTEVLQIAETHVPVVQLVCTNCGYIMNYAAVPIGLYTLRQAPPQ